MLNELLGGLRDPETLAKMQAFAEAYGTQPGIVNPGQQAGQFKDRLDELTERALDHKFAERERELQLQEMERFQQMQQSEQKARQRLSENFRAQAPIDHQSRPAGLGDFMGPLMDTGQMSPSMAAPEGGLARSVDPIMEYILAAGSPQEIINATNPGLDGPSSVAEFEYRKQLPGGIGGQADQDFLHGKRQLQFLNRGDQFTGVGNAEGESLPINPKVSETPEFRSQVKTAVDTASKSVTKQFNKPAAVSALLSGERRFNNVSSLIDDVQDNVNVWTAGFIGKSLSGLPGTQARDVLANIETIEANIGFDELQRLRDASPTGGALGQVSERELAYLQQVVASVKNSQSPEQLRENLERLKAEVKNSWDNVRRVYILEYGDDDFVDVPRETDKSDDEWTIEEL